MIKFYVIQIKLRKMTIEEVPLRFRKKVKEALED